VVRKTGSTSDVDDGAASGDRRRFAFEKAGELWMSDVMHGPAV